MPREDFRQKHTLRVRWAEVDKQGVVFNAHYLTYFDVGITEYWRTLGMPYPDGIEPLGSDFYAVKASVEFHDSARYDDLIDVCARAARLGTSSIAFAVEIFRADELVAKGEVIWVHVLLADKRPAPLPESIRSVIRRFEIVPPEERPSERS